MKNKTTFKQLFDNALSALLSNNALFAEYHKRSSGKKPEWTRQANTPNAQEIKNWKNGVMAATDPENPRRGDLMRFYQMMMLDNHLGGVIDTRILRVQRSPFKLTDDKGKENDELKQLLERPWFEDLIRLVLFSRFQGTTLIELFDIDAETLELERVDEIPQSNFIAQKGLIIKEEYDDRGTDFRTGVYADYYLQVGGDWDLGMLNHLAIIVLAKKLGIGSWMSYVDKFGIPPIFAITDRLDTKRRDELFEMMSTFRQNMFVVLQGNERIEVPRISESNQHNVFLALIESVCNKEISKRVLGGTATTDEKSFVGSAEVQERVAQDRYEADKLLFKYVFNNKIRPRLVKISSVYKDFDKYKLEWNDRESLNINDYIDAVQKLSTAFEFDIEEIKIRTGLPIIGTRQLFPPTADPTPPEPVNPQKKKPDAILTGANFAPPMAATWDAAIEQLAGRIWEGNAKASDLNRDLVLKYYATLNKAAQGGWGKGYFDEDLTRRFRENMLKFSGAKSCDLITKMIELKAGTADREAYTEAAKKLITLHNDTYQKVEDKFAANSASSARDFNRYVKDVDIYPCLKNRTMGDGDVRETHAANEGVVKPVNEWTKIPPYEPGCRCWLEQTTEKPTKYNLENLDEKWANNPVLSGELFIRNNAYFIRMENTLEGDGKNAVWQNTERMKEYMPYNRQIKHGNKTVFVNDFYHGADYEANIARTKLLIDELKKDIYIRPHFEGVAKKKSPEYGIGRQSVKGDLKILSKAETGNFFNNSIKKASEQESKYIILDISSYRGKAENLSKEIQNSLIFGGLEKHTNVKKLVIIRDNSCVTLTRKQVYKGMFNGLRKLDKQE